MHSGIFWSILEHSEYILNAFLNIMHAFWNILEHSGTYWNILEHSGTFWIILDVVEGCRKVDFQVDDRRTDGHTDIRTC